MDVLPFRVALLYNEDTQISRGDPQDILAIQYTVTAAQKLFEALAGLGYPVTKIVVRDSLEELEDTLCSFPPKETFVFNNCDGFNGDNIGASQVIQLIERMGFKHTGAPAEAIRLCIDKPRCKELLLKCGVPTPPYQVYERPEGECRLKFPVIVKPATEDASMGIDVDSVVCCPDALMRRVAYVVETYAEPAIVEEFVPGRELHAAMLGNGAVEVLPIAEEDFSRIPDPLQRVLTYDSKWKQDSADFRNIPSRIPAPLTKKEERVVRRAAAASFHAMGLRDLGRVDFRFHNGVPFVIDVNELPDLSPEAGFWNSARAANLTYPQMAERILRHALLREGWIHDLRTP
jgi:D-alanine-D-alanine ligase